MSEERAPWSRRRFIATGVGLGVGIYAMKESWARFNENGWKAEVFVGRAKDYSADFADLISKGFSELGLKTSEIKGKTILLKPNLVEPQEGVVHINTHPAVVRGAVEAFLRAGAGKVMVVEGAGHRRDSLMVLEQSGLGEVLREDRIRFVDLNYETGSEVINPGFFTSLKTFTIPDLLQSADWVVSMPKLKTHHWAGVTLSMKNLFGTLPGIYYGWPKNVLHQEGVQNSILDLTATICPNFCIVDGVVGMEGDGPIMGTPKEAGLIIMGRNPVAVDATGARLMGIDPWKISYLERASGWLGPVKEGHIEQRGESLLSATQPFELIEKIDAMRGIRLI